VKYIPRILAYLRPYWKWASASVILTVLSSSAALLAPWPLKVIVDSVVGTHPLGPLLAHAAHLFGTGKLAVLVFAVVAGLLIVGIENALTVLHSFITTSFEQKMILDFRGDMFQHAQKLSLADRDKKRAGAMIYAINYQ
jgi:ATP-binding cassette subfamily B protein